MVQTTLYVVLAFIASALYFIAISGDGWGCKGTLLLDKSCNTDAFYLVTGVLFLIAGVLICFGAIMLVLYLIYNRKFLYFSTVFLALFSTIVGASGEIHYVGSMKMWFPILTAAGVTLTIIISAFMIYDQIKRN